MIYADDDTTSYVENHFPALHLKSAPQQRGDVMCSNLLNHSQSPSTSEESDANTVIINPKQPYDIRR